MDINPAFHLYYKCCILVWVDLNLTSRVFSRYSGFLPPQNRLHNPSGCSAVLWGQTWVMFRDRAPRQQHSSFGPTSLSCTLSNSVYDWEKGQLASQVKSIKAGIGRHHLRKKTIQFYSVPDKTQALQPLLNARSLGILCHKSLTWALIFQKTCNWKYIFLSRLGAESQENSYTDKFEDLLRRWSIVHY